MPQGFVAADDGFQGYASRCDKLQPLASLVNTTWLNTGPCFLVFQCWLISSVRGKATEWGGVAGRETCTTTRLHICVKTQDASMAHGFQWQDMDGAQSSMILAEVICSTSLKIEAARVL